MHTPMKSSSTTGFSGAVEYASVAVAEMEIAVVRTVLSCENLT